jgi:hypothetical protein
MALTTTDGSKSLYTFFPETVPGTAAAGAYQTLRSKVGVKFDLKRDTFMSKDRRADRMESSLSYGNKSGTFSIPVEWSYGTYDSFLEAVLGGTWGAPGTTVLKIGNVVRTFTFEETSNELAITEQVLGAQLGGLSISQKVNGIADGDFSGVYRSATVAQCKGVQITLSVTTITRSTGKWSDDGFGTNFTAGSRLLKVTMQGNANATYNNVVITVTAQTDTVLTVTGLGVVAAADNIVVNLAPNATTAVGTTTIAPFDSFTGTITEGGTTIAHVTGWDLKVDQTIQPNFACASDSAQSVSVGTIKVSGNLSVYYIDESLRKKFVNGTGSSLTLILGSVAATKAYTLALGTVKYTTNTRDDNEMARTETMGFSATYDSTNMSTLMVTRTP